MKTKARLALLALLALSLAPAAHAQVDLTTSVFVGSPYVFRGAIFANGWVIQPTVSAGYNGFSATFFGSVFPGSNFTGGNVHFQEADLTAAYATTVSDVALGAGYTFYTFPTPGDDGVELLPTQEVFASVGYAAGPLQPGLFVAYDFDETEDNPLQGLYAEARLGMPVTLGSHGYTLGAALGFDSGYLNVDENGEDETGLSHLALTGGTTFEAGPFALTPMLGFQINLDDTYEAQIISARGMDYGKTFLYGGINIGF